MNASSDHRVVASRLFRPAASRLLGPILVALTTLGRLTAGAEDVSPPIGLVRLELPAGLSIVSIPFTSGDNHLNTLLPLPDSADGATLFRFVAATGAYGQPIQFFGGNVGWHSFDTNASWLTVFPGESFFLWVAEPLVINILGEVPQGTRRTAIHGFNSFSMNAPPAARVGRVGHGSDGTGNATGLTFPAKSEDRIFIFDSTTQTYREPYVYYAGPGWTSTSDPDPDGPILGLASGFFLHRTMAPDDWVMVFDINAP